MSARCGWDTNWDAQPTPSTRKSSRHGTAEIRVAATLPCQRRWENTGGAHSGKHLPAIRRALRLIEEWKLNAVLYGGQMGYEVAPEIAAKKMPVLVDLKWAGTGKRQ